MPTGLAAHFLAWALTFLVAAPVGSSWVSRPIACEIFRMFGRPLEKVTYAFWSGSLVKYQEDFEWKACPLKVTYRETF